MARPKAPCGTDAAYRRHLREGVEPDEACRRAHTEAGRASASSRIRRLAATAPVDTPPPPDAGGDEGDDMKLIVDTLRSAFTKIAEADPARLAPIAREFRAAVEASRATAPAEKELTLADQLAAARAARAARAAG